MPEDFYISIDYDKDALRQCIAQAYQEFKDFKSFTLKKVIEFATENWLIRTVKNKYPAVTDVIIEDFIINSSGVIAAPLLTSLSRIGLVVDYIKIRMEYDKKYNLKSFFVNGKNTNKFYWGEYYKSWNYNNKGIACTEIRNLYYSPKLFKGLREINNCSCSKLVFWDNPINDIPVFFWCENCGQIYVCECQKPYYEYFAQQNSDFLANAKYKENICHLCQNEIPLKVYNYCELTDFAKNYYPYIKVLSIAKNISWQNAENEIRQKIGIRCINESKTFNYNETLLYKLCCQIFVGCNIIKQYTPNWLGLQRIDIYIEELNLGIEYQGEQHFKPIKFFGGIEGFEMRKELDKKKSKLCKKNGLPLIYFKYNEEITEDYVIKKLKKYYRTYLNLKLYKKQKKNHKIYVIHKQNS